MKPDYGYFLYETTKNLGPHHFYDVLIMNIDRIDRNLFTSTINRISDGVEYCISFDISMSQMGRFIDQISNKEDQINLLKLITTQNKFKYDFMIPFKLNSVECTISDMYINNKEWFRPLTISNII